MILIIICIFIRCNDQKPGETSNEEKKFTIMVSMEKKGYTGKDIEILEEKNITIVEGKSAMEYLRDNFEARDKGGFIFEIEGIHNKYPIPESQKTEEQKKNKIMGIDWFIYLNDEKTSVGANDIYPKENDQLLFDIHEWDKREFLSEK